MLSSFVVIAIALNSVVTLDRAEFRVDPSATIPVSGEWQAVALKDWWTPDRYELGRHGWYRIRVDLDQALQAPLGILVHRVNMNAEFYLNGEKIASGGRFEEPVSRNWNYPLYAAPPVSLWKVGENIIHVRHVSYAASGSLPELHIGPTEILGPEAETLTLVQSGIARFLFPVTVFISILMLATWLRRRRDRYYLWFSMAIAAWSMYILNMFVRDIWVPIHVWEWLAHFAVDAWVVAFCFFAYQYTGLSLRIMGWVYGVYISVIGIMYATVSLATLDDIVMYTHALSMAFGAHMIVELFRAAARMESVTLYIISGGLVILLGTGIHDWIFQSHWSGQTGIFPLHLHYYSAPLVFGFIAWHLTSRFSVALNEAEILNRELEDRVQDAERELEARFEQINAYEKAHAVMTEQDRLSKEIHDGVGGSLANAIMLTDLIDRSQNPERVPQLKTVLEDALAEVRHLISAMAGDISTTEELCQYVTERVRPTIDGTGIEFALENQIRDMLVLSSNQGLNLARVIMEALNNAIRHADAKHLKMLLGTQEGFLRIDIQDDGVGFSVHETVAGYGLKNMQRRVSDVGGTVEIESSPGVGTQVSVLMPV